MGESASSATVTKRMIPLYKNILSECIHGSDCTWAFVKELYSQTWFRKVLDYVDAFGTDEDPKYRTLLKTKSATLFWLYICFIRLKAKLHRSTIND